MRGAAGDGVRWHFVSMRVCEDFCWGWCEAGVLSM